MSAPVPRIALVLALLLAATPVLVATAARADDTPRDRRHDDTGIHDTRGFQNERGVREPHAPPAIPAPPDAGRDVRSGHGFDPDARARYDRYRHERFVPPPPAFRPRGYRFEHLPGTYHRVPLHDRTYFYFDGMFLEPRLGAYIVVGAPLGARVPFLPAGYVSFFVGPQRYFYVNATYYLWDTDEFDYVVVDAPEGADEARQSGDAGEPDGLFVYPARGQSDDELRRDRFECHEWAVAQTGYDPTLAAPASKGRSGYLRAMTACLEGRGYTVK